MACPYSGIPFKLKRSNNSHKCSVRSCAAKQGGAAYGNVSWQRLQGTTSPKEEKMKIDSTSFSVIAREVQHVDNVLIKEAGGLVL